MTTTPPPTSRTRKAAEPKTEAVKSAAIKAEPPKVAVKAEAPRTEAVAATPIIVPPAIVASPAADVTTDVAAATVVVTPEPAPAPSPAPTATVILAEAVVVPAVARNYEHAIAFTKEQVEKVSQNAFKTYEELTALNKDTVDALVQSSSVVAKGVESLSRAFLAFAQTSLEHSVSTAKALLAVKTLREAVDLQSEFAKSSFDSLVAEATKASELSVKVANEAIQPLSSHVNTVVSKLSKKKEPVA